MDMVDVIARSNGGRGMVLLAAKFGLTERQARAAVEQLAPAVMAGLRREVQTGPDGVSGLLKAIATGNHQRHLAGDDGMVDDGNAILGHVFKSKDVSRGVADRAAAASGVSADVLRRMLPVVTAMVMGGLSQQLVGAQPTAPAKVTTGRSTSRSTGTSTGTKTATPAPAKVTTSRSTQSRSTQPAATRPGVSPAPASAKVVRPAPATRASAAAPQPAPTPAPAQAGLGGLLGQLLGGGGAGSTGGSAAGAGGLGGLGGLLGQLVGGGGGSGASSGGGGIGDLLGGLLGGNAQPAARAQASQSIGDLLSGLLGGGTTRGNEADELLNSVTRGRTGR